MSKNKITAAVAAAALVGGLAPMALPTVAVAQQANGITNCDAPGGRQRTGAIIGAIVGGLAGSQISDNERTLGAVVGAGAGAAAALALDRESDADPARHRPVAGRIRGAGS